MYIYMYSKHYYIVTHDHLLLITHACIQAVALNHVTLWDDVLEVAIDAEGEV